MACKHLQRSSCIGLLVVGLLDMARKRGGPTAERRPALPGRARLRPGSLPRALQALVSHSTDQKPEPSADWRPLGLNCCARASFRPTRWRFEAAGRFRRRPRTPETPSDLRRVLPPTASVSLGTERSQPTSLGLRTLPRMRAAASVLLLAAIAGARQRPAVARLRRLSAGAPGPGVGALPAALRPARQTSTPGSGPGALLCSMRRFVRP